MSLWKQHKSLAELNAWNAGRMMEHVGIELIELGPDYLKGRMPVDHRTHQPMGLLHGGASAVLAETLGSFASSLCIDPEVETCLGLEINANHIGSASSGYVIGTARPIHVGRTTHVWDIRIESEAGKLVCVSRLTMAVLARPRAQFKAQPKTSPT